MVGLHDLQQNTQLRNIFWKAQHGGFCSAVERFDNASFRISPAEAEAMDPQQRMLLEAGYLALHGSGQRRAGLMGGDSGVFVGIERPDWALLQALRRLGPQQAAAMPSAFAVTGDTINVAAGRLSFVLGLQGPCVSMDTACSSALAALHAASSGVMHAAECVRAPLCGRTWREVLNVSSGVIAMRHSAPAADAHAVRTPHGWPKRTLSSWICDASSRVGARTRAMGPSPGCEMGCALTWTRAGSR